MAEYNYAKQKQKKNIEDTIEMLKEMPDFVDYYFKSNSLSLSASSQHSYMYDIYNFLKWWHSSLPELSDTELKDMSTDYIAKVTSTDILDYIAYMRNVCFRL